jgi:hypothetical protein
MIKPEVQIYIGDPRDMGERSVSAWNRALASEAVDERHATFLSREAMLAAQSSESPDSSPE